ncbi:probable carboxylesterase 12 [Lotus japonicus]|uniref:probable carboxylesterase 12 n=1 Tax=Lotus japonicus TaxID=34305 RepID=UPI00258307DB|nr:probable carboxylesterase 12 [Lotus japonicus]
MDSSSNEVVQDFSPLVKIYKDGRVERLVGCEYVPPSFDPITNVNSKDMVISREDEDISARIYLPKLNDENQKLPLLVYFHGGGFCVGTPFDPAYHQFLNTVVSQGNVIGVSVHYRLAPEHPVPIAFEDSWTVLKWIASHCGGNGPDEWLNRHADFGNVFFSGDSAGGTIAHQMGIRVGTEGLPGFNLEGIALIHAFFWGVERIGSEAEKPEGVAFMENWWRFTCPTTTGSDDPLVNPAKDPNLGKLGCKRLLVCVAGNDLLKDRGWYLKELLEKSGWQGVVEVVEAKGEEHVFHLFKPNCENAVSLFNQIASFINHS